MSLPIKVKFQSLSAILILFLLSSTCYVQLNAQPQIAVNQTSYLEALKNYNLGNTALAEKQFREITLRDPSNDAAHYYIAVIHLRRGEIGKAEEAMLKAIKRDPSNSWYKQQLASIYTHLGKISKAVTLYNELREEHPGQSELYDALIELYIDSKEFSKAKEVLEDIERSVGVNEGTGLTRYNLMIFDGKQDEAFTYLVDFDRDFGTPRTATIIGDNYAAMQNDSLAERYYTKALTLAPDYVPASFGLAEVNRVKGHFDLYFERMYPFLANIDIDPFMKISYMKQILTNTRFVQTFLPQIDTMMTNMYTAHPEDSSIAYTHALFLVQSDRSGEALEVLLENLTRYPNSKEAHRQYLSLIYYLGMWEPMERKSEEALKVFRNDTDFMQFKGIAQLQLGRLDSSIATFKEILKYSKRDSTTTVNTLVTIGDINYRAGNKKEAYRYYRKTIKKEPRHLPALNNYAYFLGLDGKDLKKAYKMSKITIEEEPNNPTYLDTFAWILHLMGNNIEAKAVLKHAIVYGGKENAEILNHYAHVLFALKEYDLAFIYWGQADKLDPSLGIAEIIESKKREIKQQ
jgi:tetratricopeptide (TPR) repeat protein